MKKVLVAVAMVMGLGSSVAFAQEVKDSTTVEQTQTPQVEFVVIEAEKLPSAVIESLAKTYEGGAIKESYVAAKESGNVYKIIVITKEKEEVTALLNEKGEEVKE